MKDFIRAIVIRPGQEPRIGTQRNTLKAFQERVGGNIECVTISPSLVIICDDEGRLKGYDHTAKIGGYDFCGTIIAVGVNEEYFTDVPEDEFWKYYQKPTEVPK